MATKKSRLYYEAQLSVLRDELLDDAKKLAILRLLQGAEDFAKYTEQSNEEKE